MSAEDRPCLVDGGVSDGQHALRHREISEYSEDREILPVQFEGVEESSALSWPALTYSWQAVLFKLSGAKYRELVVFDRQSIDRMSIIARSGPVACEPVQQRTIVIGLNTESPRKCKNICELFFVVSWQVSCARTLKLRNICRCMWSFGETHSKTTNNTAPPD